MYRCNYIVWYHQFSHCHYLLDNLGVSTGSIVIRIFGFDYYVSNIYCILFCYYFDSNVLIQIPKLFIFFKSILQQNKLWYPDPQSLLQCEYLICHRGGQLIATHCSLFNYLFFSYPRTSILPIPSKPFIMDDDDTFIWRVYCHRILRSDTWGHGYRIDDLENDLDNNDGGGSGGAVATA